MLSGSKLKSRKMRGHFAPFPGGSICPVLKLYQFRFEGGQVTPFLGGQFDRFLQLIINIKKSKAIVKISFPNEVKNPFRYEWDTDFYELGGYVGYELTAEDCYIKPQDSYLMVYKTNWSETVKVKPGGKATIDYWCDYDIKWAGGKFHCIWNGQDDLGNKISIIQEVILKK